MKKHIFSLILSFSVFLVIAQDIPNNQNAYDLDSNKTGTWTILYNSNWNITNIVDSAEFFRIINYKDGSPNGKVVDYFITGEKQWEGFLLSDYPEDLYANGEFLWFDKDGSVTGRKIVEDNKKQEYFFNKKKLVFETVRINDSIVSCKIFAENIEDIPLDLSYLIANTYFTIAEYNVSATYYKQILILLQKQNVKNSEQCLFVLEQLMVIYSKYVVDFDILYSYAEQYYEICKELYGEIHVRSAEALDLVCQITGIVGGSDKQEENVLKELLSIYEKLYGRYHEKYVRTSFLLDKIYLSQKQPVKVFFKGQSSMVDSIFTENDTCSLSAINELEEYKENYMIRTGRWAADSSYEFRKFDHQRWEREEYKLEKNLTQEAYKRYMRQQEWWESRVCRELSAIGMELFAEANYQFASEEGILFARDSIKKNKDLTRALEWLLKADSTRQLLGDTSSNLELFSSIYSELGDYERSLKYQKEKLQIIERKYGREGNVYFSNLSILASEYIKNKDFSEAFLLFLECQEYDMKMLNEDEPDFTMLLYDWNRIFNLSNKLGVNYAVKDQYNYLSLLKGREIKNTISMISTVYESKNAALIKKCQDWMHIKEEINMYMKKNIIQRKTLDIDINELKFEESLLSKQLKKEISIFLDSQQEYEFSDVSSNLKKKEVYLDFISVHDIDFDKNEYKDLQYYTYIIKRGDTVPELVHLGSASYFDSIFYMYYSKVYHQHRRSTKEFSKGDQHYGNRCYNVFWNKLEPYLDDISTVYFSPEGIYSKINPNVLYDSRSSSFLIDKYDIVYVSNVDDFVHQKKKIKKYEATNNANAILIGNPKFYLDTKDADFILASQLYQVEEFLNSNIIINEDDLNEPLDSTDFLASNRSINGDNLYSLLSRGMNLFPLPATQLEIDLISNILADNGFNSIIYLDKNAKEEYLTNIDAPKILHLATHGYFLEHESQAVDVQSLEIEDDDLDMFEFMSGNSAMRRKYNKEMNPLFRSGLILAGAGNTLNGEILAEGNGWLNAYEVSMLNLRGTELVVLSACKTGAGDMKNGQGVYGLQRAIRVAGAESLIMSMWEVDDKATQELMTYFYDYWIDKKMTKKEAFKEAQQKIREKYKHPYYWGAFIMLGE
jgi:CHAT domain-containing protein